MTEMRLEHIISHLDSDISHHIGMETLGHGAQNIFFCGHQLVGPASACNLLAKPASRISQAVQHCTMRRTAAEGCTASPADCSLLATSAYQFTKAVQQSRSRPAHHQQIVSKCTSRACFWHPSPSIASAERRSALGSCLRRR